MRERLVARIAQSRAIRDERVLDAMRSVPRHLFIPDAPVEQAYRDRILRIGYGQTISQPSIVAIMSQALDVRATDRVLEIGTGSGYQAAVLSRLAREVLTIEIIAPLGEAAHERLRALGFDNVHVRIGDGYAGWPEHAPFNRVMLTAAPVEIPRALVDQLADGGVLVAPVGEGMEKHLVRLHKTDGSVVREDLGPVRFVPMVPGEDANP